MTHLQRCGVVLSEGNLRREHELSHGGQDTMLWHSCVAVNQQYVLSNAHVTASKKGLIRRLRQRPEAHLLQRLVLVQHILLCTGNSCPLSPHMHC